jgi:hypothetical protein
MRSRIKKRKIGERIMKRGRSTEKSKTKGSFYLHFTY